MAEIRKAHDLLAAGPRFRAPKAAAWLLPLHSSVSSEQQRRVFQVRQSLCLERVGFRCARRSGHRTPGCLSMTVVSQPSTNGVSDPGLYTFPAAVAGAAARGAQSRAGHQHCRCGSDSRRLAQSQSKLARASVPDVSRHIQLMCHAATTMRHAHQLRVAAHVEKAPEVNRTKLAVCT